MAGHANSFQRRVASARMRIAALSSLRKTVALPRGYDITARQWSVIENQLVTVQERLQSRLKRAAREHFPQLRNPKAIRSFNSLLGEIELEMTTAFTFYDTYSDVLTQRNSAELGPLLGGCDVLAWDALRRDHPALSMIEPPLVHCDRGFGASILREGVLFPDKSPNPMPLIQIPYSRLKEKWNLTSILHEAGHEAMSRLGLNKAIPNALRAGLKDAGALDSIADLFALWASEIGPDFWAFCGSGLAQAAGIREILALPPGHVFRVSWTDPHPPPYLRALLSFAWCRQVWGRGRWDDWETEWLELYPLERAPRAARIVLERGKACLSMVGRILIETKFAELNGKTIPDLFNLSAVNPSELEKVARTADSGRLNLCGLSPATQLAVFRVVREQGKLAEEVIDRTMTQWLGKLGEKRTQISN